MAPPKPLYKKKDPVQILDDGSFIGPDSHIIPELFNGPGLLKVYAPWCIHCQAKVKCLNLLAGYLHKHGMEVYVLDGTDNNPIFIETFNVRGYPTFLEVDSQGNITGLLKDKQGEQVYTVPSIVAALCGNDPSICKYAKKIDQCTKNNSK